MARYVRVQTIRHAIGAGGSFGLKVTSADITARGVDGDDVSVRATFEIRADSEQDADEIFSRVQLVADATQGRLALSEPDGSPSLRGVLDRLLRGRAGVDLNVEAEIPVGAAVRVETVSGDMSGEGLQGRQRYTTVSGDLFLRDAGGDLRVNTVSGDVTVRGDHPLALRSEAVSGDLSVAVPRLEAFRTNSVSGDIEVEGELAPAGEFATETVSGDVSVGLVGSATFEVRGLSTDISSDLDHRIEGRLDRRRVIIGSGLPTFRFTSLSGDLSIRGSRRMAAAERSPAPPQAAAPSDDDQLVVLQALERGEIDVEEAARRLGGR
jgi:hypothetical protein